jgi:hypothetical protein
MESAAAWAGPGAYIYMYVRLELVGTARFELATPCTPCKCATRLRHVPTGSAHAKQPQRELQSRFPTTRERYWLLIFKPLHACDSELELRPDW